MDNLAYLRQFKIGPFSIFDTVTAYVGIFILAPLLSKLFLKFHISVSRDSWMWLTLPIAVVFHLMFRQNTPFMNFLIDRNTFYIPLFVLIFMTFMGFKKETISKNTHEKI